MDQSHAVASVGLVEIGRGDEDRHPLLQQLVEDSPEIAPRHGIDAVRRLVEKQDFRRMDQAQASPSFCFIPPDRLPASRFLKGVRLLKPSRRSIFSRRPRRGSL